MNKMIKVVAISIMAAMGCVACGQTAKNEMIVETIDNMNEIEVENIEVEEIEVERIGTKEITPYEILQGVKTVLTLIVN